MAISYSLTEKVNPGKPRDPKKWYARAKSSGELTLRELADRIAEISTVSQIDTLGVLEGLLQVLPKELSDGKIIRLGEFGSFYITISSEGAESKEKFTKDKIKKASIKFRPGKMVKDTLLTADYKRVD